MAGVEYVEFLVSETDDNRILVVGTPTAMAAGWTLVTKYREQVPSGLGLVYCSAKEMQMNFAAYYFHDANTDESWQCRCFQGDADFVESLLHDPQNATYLRKIMDRIADGTIGMS